jgi:hypothetical protein
LYVGSAKVQNRLKPLVHLSDSSRYQFCRCFEGRRISIFLDTDGNSMLKFGVTTVKQLFEGKKLTFLRRKKTISITLYDQLPDTPYADKLAEGILVQFLDDRRAFKRTYSARFNDFDQRALETIASIAPSKRDLVVHDTGVSDARTSVNFFERIERKFPRLLYYASDYDPELFVVEKGGVKIVLTRNHKVLEMYRPPFVFNMLRRESMIAYPVNHLMRFALKRIVGRGDSISLEQGAKKSPFSVQQHGSLPNRISASG